MQCLPFTSLKNILLHEISERYVQMYRKYCKHCDTRQHIVSVRERHSHNFCLTIASRCRNERTSESIVVLLGFVSFLYAVFLGRCHSLICTVVSFSIYENRYVLFILIVMPVSRLVHFRFYLIHYSHTRERVMYYCLP